MELGVRELFSFIISSSSSSSSFSSSCSFFLFFLILFLFPMCNIVLTLCYLVAIGRRHWEDDSDGKESRVQIRRFLWVYCIALYCIYCSLPPVVFSLIEVASYHSCCTSDSVRFRSGYPTPEFCQWARIIREESRTWKFTSLRGLVAKVVNPPSRLVGNSGADDDKTSWLPVALIAQRRYRMMIIPGPCSSGYRRRVGSVSRSSSRRLKPDRDPQPKKLISSHLRHIRVRIPKGIPSHRLRLEITPPSTPLPPLFSSPPPSLIL
ncbi:hypothetical protein EX30DRAFT_138748 [Ascodesmis nigricans]|uniref:Uncharacterized protein n=1 Tax=Ascodesmis nigricans TaxID=341454 RepID=A0A4S2N0Z1_9PEZI|nr:hypothetical protein EX30DRAFT_138748 [Ascodesmis nigricans]